MWPNIVRTSKVRRMFSACVLGRNEKMEKGVAWICYQSRGLLRSPTTSPRPALPGHQCRAYWLAGNTPVHSASRIHKAPHSSIRILSLDTLDIPVRCISKYPEFSRIFRRLHPSDVRIFALWRSSSGFSGIIDSLGSSISRTSIF